MSSKKKKIKLNNSIKKIFNGAEFDQGIALVDLDSLIALKHFLGIDNTANTKDTLVKTYRHLWSDGDIYIRSAIVDFFNSNKKIYKKTSKIDDVVLRLREITYDMYVEEDEFNLLVENFSTTNTSKITNNSVLNKLDYIRYKNKISIIEKNEDGTFDYNNSFVFYENILCKNEIENFSKIFVIKTVALEDDELKYKDIDEICTIVDRYKSFAVKKFQKKVVEYIESFNKNHKYISYDIFIDILKKANPEFDFKGLGLDSKDIKKLLLQRIEDVKITINENDVLLSKKETLVIDKNNIIFDNNIHLDKNKISFDIYKENDIYYDDEFNENKENILSEFSSIITEIIFKCKKHSEILNFNDDEVKERVYELITPYIGSDLHISYSSRKKIIKLFIQSIQKLIIQRQKEELLARSIRDFKNLFPLSREINRELVLHIGPTNSGKTYSAMKELKDADTGFYLAPLRLLALEGYEELKKHGVDSSLVTGEEQIIDEDSTHISSTIEMLNFNVDVDVCVIDEVQMIGDDQRGWAWANAIIGAPAKKIIMTGSSNVKDAIIALAEYLGEKLTIVEFERKNPLIMQNSITQLKNIEKGSALIAFSRKNVLKYKQALSKTHNVSVLYGNLSPEVRREEARRFREGESDVLVATDAIAMGLNLPIKKIVFSTSVKYDGVSDRRLRSYEVKQISGRAGRYGLEENGYVSALDPKALKDISDAFYEDDKTIEVPFAVSANLDHIRLVYSILEENSLKVVLEFFVKNIDFSGPFRAVNLESMIEASEIVDEYDLEVDKKYYLASAPISFRSEYIVNSYKRYIQAVVQSHPISYIPPKELFEVALSEYDLLQAEDYIKDISLYLWLSYRFPDIFVDTDKAVKYRGLINSFIERSLKQTHFLKRCRECSKTLPTDSKFAICDSCFNKQKKYRRKTTRRY